MNFEKGYFVQSDTSNYEDYRGKKFDKLADDLIQLLFLTEDTTILDFGCATGGLLKSFKERGFQTLAGTDISYWAIEYGKKTLGLEEELDYYNVNLLTCDYDVILFLDVLEHVPSVGEIKKYLNLVKAGTRIVVRVPVSEVEGEPYVLQVSSNDSTHVQCHSKEWWINLLAECGFISGSSFIGRAIYESKGVFARCYKKEKAWKEHIHKEGSFRHVLSYDTEGRYCSEKDCEVNKERK